VSEGKVLAKCRINAQTHLAGCGKTLEWVHELSAPHSSVIPAKAGIQLVQGLTGFRLLAFATAGMTTVKSGPLFPQPVSGPFSEFGDAHPKRGAGLSALFGPWTIPHFSLGFMRLSR
jgi:hypothetical protein